jgi:hypothetical protein
MESKEEQHEQRASFVAVPVLLLNTDGRSLLYSNKRFCVEI